MKKKMFLLLGFIVISQLVIAQTDQISNNQQKECKNYYKDGYTIQYYVCNGISVSMCATVVENYGKYYIAHISIENLTGKSFNFNPDEITAVYENRGKKKSVEALSYNEYMKKVSNRQAWQAFAVAYGQTYAANQAGYSSSTTTTSGYSNSYGNASGYYGNTPVSVSGTVQTTNNSTSTSRSYNGAANYAAQQNAQQNVSNFQGRQYSIKSELQEGYLKLNTIENEQRINGCVNFKYEKAESISITVSVNGEDYVFLWAMN